MDRISIELSDDLTLGMLRTLAQNMGKRLVLSFEGNAGGGAVKGARRGRPPGSGRKAVTAAAGASEAQAPAKRGRRRRKLSDEARANLARNLMKARAARSANAKAARMGKAKQS